MRLEKYMVSGYFIFLPTQYPNRKSFGLLTPFTVFKLYVILRSKRPTWSSASQRIGIAKGKFTMPDDFDADNKYIASLFM